MNHTNNLIRSNLSAKSVRRAVILPLSFHHHFPHLPSFDSHIQLMLPVQITIVTKNQIEGIFDTIDQIGEFGGVRMARFWVGILP